MIALLAALSVAAPQTTFAVGIESSLNDPFVVRRGLRGAFAVEPLRIASLGVSVAGFPYVPSIDDTGLYKSLTDQQIRPDVAPIVADGRALLTLYPLHRDTEQFRTRIGFEAGAGLIRVLQPSYEDLSATGDGRWYGSSVFGVVGDVVGVQTPLGVRVRFERESFRGRWGPEDDSRYDSYRGYLFAGVDFVVRP